MMIPYDDDDPHFDDYEEIKRRLLVWSHGNLTSERLDDMPLVEVYELAYRWNTERTMMMQMMSVPRMF